MPRAERHLPLHLQISGHYKRMMMSGQIRSGDRLPSMRAIQAEWEVGLPTAQRAIDHLKTEGLVRTGPAGTYANGQRVKTGPQQQMRAGAAPASERIEMRSAGLVEAPAYIVPILGLEEAKPGLYPVIRREWVTCEEDGTPYMLTSSWCPGRAAKAVPELMALEPLPGSGSAAKLIAERTGREVAWGQSGHEVRRIKDDGREGPLLQLPLGAMILAEVYTWGIGEDVLEYGEFVVIAEKVIHIDMEP
jgi:GntR family transcriptional regulator